MRKKKSNKKIVLLIVVIFVLTLIGTGLYFVLEKGNVTKPNYDDYYNEYVITNKESKIYINKKKVFFQPLKYNLQPIPIYQKTFLFYIFSIPLLQIR